MESSRSRGRPDRLRGHAPAIPRGGPLVRGLLAHQRRRSAPPPWRRARGEGGGLAMSSSPDVALIHGLRETARPLSDGDPHDALIEAIGDARLVLLGEASHGTHDFYAERARLTQRLIVEKGFHAVAVEADWPDAYRVNRFVRNLGEDRDADTALSGFKRFPVWMWRNVDVLDFVRWLRAHDDSLPAGAPKVGFYGVDLYSLHASIDEVLKYLAKVDPEAARLARERYRCFDDLGGNVEEYARSAALGVVRSCEDAVVKQLVDLLQQRSAPGAAGDGDGDEEWFQAVQNARVVKNAEEYYRTMYRANVESWNLRDQHMAETIEELLLHRLGIPRFALDLRQLGAAAGGLREPRLEPAIGVLYLPATERWSHYFGVLLPGQFDTVIHLDVTTAVEPLERLSLWDAGDPAETYPYGL